MATFTEFDSAVKHYAEHQADFPHPIIPHLRLLFPTLTPADCCNVIRQVNVPKRLLRKEDADAATS